MIHSSIFEDELQVKPYICTGSLVIDTSTGEIIVDLSSNFGDLTRIRADIDWVSSLRRLERQMPNYEAVYWLMQAYKVIYPDWPDFVPGFATMRAAPGREEAAAQHRGLSTYNKVPKVYIKNTATGETFEVLPKKVRIAKMRKRIFSWANTIKDYLPAYGKGAKVRKVMITLTYADVDGWRANHIRDYIKNLKRRLGDNAIAIAWCAELQERGAVHYHVELLCKKGSRIPLPDKSGMWKHGSSRIETAKSVFYICSYMKKAYQKEGEFPKGCRMFSVWINPSVITSLARWFFRLSTLPKWLYDNILALPDLQGSSWERCKGGGFIFGGKFYKSPFYFVGFG